MPYSVKQRVKQFREEMRKLEQANKEREMELQEMEIMAKVGIAKENREAKKETENKKKEEK